MSASRIPVCHHGRAKHQCDDCTPALHGTSCASPALSRRRSLASEWAGYSKTLPETAGPTQFAETKRAFYAGAIALNAAVMTNLSEGSDVTPEDLAYMDSLQQELEAYSARIVAGSVA